MTPAQESTADLLQKELREMASREKVQYKARTLYDAANLLRDLLNDSDEPVPVDDL